MNRSKRDLDDPRDLRLGLAEFRMLRDIVSANSGLDLLPSQRITIERKLRDRVALLGLDNFADYVRTLRDPMGRNELDEALDLLTTNETYFFREDYQLNAFREEVIPLLAKSAQSRQRLAIWSAGCSTGEEPYSLAIMLLEAPELAGFELRVFGSDISRRCIAHARRAVYGPSSFRTTPSDYKRRWFVERPDGFQVHERVRSICHFGHVNLLDAERAATVGRVDAVFCRNVLIYLEQSARRRVIDLFHERLYPGGVLLLGHSESLLNVSTAFELLHLRTDLVYRRPPLSARRTSTLRDPMRETGTREVSSLRDTGIHEALGSRDSAARDSGRHAAAPLATHGAREPSGGEVT